MPTTHDYDKAEESRNRQKRETEDEIRFLVILFLVILIMCGLFYFFSEVFLKFSGLQWIL